MLKALALTRRRSLADATAAIQNALRLVVADERPRRDDRAKGATIAPDDVGERASVVRRAASSAADAVDAGPSSGTPGSASSWKTPLEHGFIAGRHSFAGASRNYKLFVPVRLAAEPSLIVMLHGCTQGPDDFAAGTRLNEWASRDGFLVLYPEQSRSANPSSCWNWFQTNDQQRDHGEAGLIASLTRSIVSQYAVDATRVYVAGLSAGGAMAANLAIAYPDLYAAVAIHSGLVAGAANNVVDALTAMRNGTTRHAKAGKGTTPTIVFHGDDDRTVHPSNADRIVSAALDDGAADPAVETGTSPGGRAWSKRSYKDSSGDTRVEHWKLEAAGHAWAGGDAAGTYTDPKGVDATREMLRFFAMHRLDAPVAA